jgi:hypothetical protein
MPTFIKAQELALYAVPSAVSDPPCGILSNQPNALSEPCDLSPQNILTPSLSRNRWRGKYYRGPSFNAVDIKAELQDALIASGVLNCDGSKFRVTSRNIPSKTLVAVNE